MAGIAGGRLGGPGPIAADDHAPPTPGAVFWVFQTGHYSNTAACWITSAISPPQFPNGIVSSVSLVSTTNTARSLAGLVLLAFALTPWRSPGSSEKLCPAL